MVESPAASPTDARHRLTRVDRSMVKPRNRTSCSLGGQRHGFQNRSCLFIHNHGSGMQADHQPALLVDAAPQTVLVADGHGQATDERREASQRHANLVVDPLSIRGRDLQVFQQKG